MATLGVNIDHIATLREVRKTSYPDPVIAAKIVQDAGADQLTCHLREDRRHIQDRDLPLIQQAITIPLNLEMAATEEMKRIALKLRPQKVTLVPEKRQELTTEGGIDVLGQIEQLSLLIADLKKARIEVSLFIDPDSEQIHGARQVGADTVEIHTGAYCEASIENSATELDRLKLASALAVQLGFFVAAGHGLNYQNILQVRKIPEIKEYNIGHSIVAHAVFVGLERAVQEMKSLIK